MKQKIIVDMARGRFMGKPINRTLNISARVNQEEKDIILDKMSLVGMTNLNEYLRRMAIYGYLIEIDMEPLNEISVELSRISCNLNQITKVANQTGNLYSEDLQEIRREWGEVMGKLGRFLDKLGEV